MRKLFLLLFTLISSTLTGQTADPIRFQWKWEANQILELNEYHDVLFRVGSRSLAREDRNRILLKTTNCDLIACQVSAWFDTYIRFGKTTGPFQKDKNFDSEFKILRTGKYEVPEQYVMPNLRSFPTFRNPRSILVILGNYRLRSPSIFQAIESKSPSNQNITISEKQNGISRTNREPAIR